MDVWLQAGSGVIVGTDASTITDNAVCQLFAAIRVFDAVCRACSLKYSGNGDTTSFSVTVLALLAQRTNHSFARIAAFCTVIDLSGKTFGAIQLTSVAFCRATCGSVAVLALISGGANDAVAGHAAFCTVIDLSFAAHGAIGLPCRAICATSSFAVGDLTGGAVTTCFAVFTVSTVVNQNHGCRRILYANQFDGVARYGTFRPRAAAVA